MERLRAQNPNTTNFARNFSNPSDGGGGLNVFSGRTFSAMKRHNDKDDDDEVRSRKERRRADKPLEELLREAKTQGLYSIEAFISLVLTLKTT